MLNNLPVVAAVIAAAILAVPAIAQNRAVRIANRWLQVDATPSDGTFQVTSTAGNRIFIPKGVFSAGAGTAQVGETTLPSLGKAKCITISHPSGSTETVMLVDDLPFVLLRSTFHNDATEPVVLNKVKTAALEVDLGLPASKLRVQGTHDHVVSPEKYPGSYAYLAIADPLTRNGAVFGWISQDRGSGVVFTSANQDRVRVDGQIDYGCLRIMPGKSADSEILAIGYFDDARLGLEAYADAVAKFYDIKLPPQPAGYCTWYSDKYGKASDEKHLIELAEFAKKTLQPYGLSFVQIDDYWQIGKRRQGPAKDFTGNATGPKAPYSGGMKGAADGLKELGFTPGIWFMPFAGDHEDPMFSSHLDWFVKDKEGKLFETRWGGTSLDMSDPGAREHLKQVVNSAAHEWGYQYFKMDGLYTGTATDQVYVNNGYKDQDRIGDAVFHDPDVTNIEAFRSGLKLVREVAGKDVFFLGCTVAQNMRSFGGSFGLVDAMRIGPDNNSNWPSIRRGPEHGSRKYFLHGRVWYNDPDPVYVRASVPLNIAQLIASWASISGQLFTSSDWLPNVPAERIEILKRTIAPHRLLARPVDYFETDLPRIWLLTDIRNSGRQDIVALYNWDTRSAEIKATAEYVGLPKADSYIAFDFWADRFVPPFKDQLSFTLPKQSCRILAVRPLLDRPQVLSTSRHVTQGVVDELQQSWDSSTSTLSGASTVVGDDPYELRLVTLGPAGTAWQIDSASLAQNAAPVTVAQSNGFARVKFQVPASGRVAWTIRFKPSPVKIDSTIAAVSKVESDVEGTRAVNLTWQAPAADGVAYEIKRSDGKLAVAAFNQWTDDAIEKGKTYTYAISAVDFFGHRSPAASATAVIPSKLDPGPVPPKPQISLTSLKPRVQPNTAQIGAVEGGISLPAGARAIYDRDSKAKRFVAIVSLDPKQRAADAAVTCKILSDDGEEIASTNTLAETPTLAAGDTEFWHLNVELPDSCKRVHILVERADESTKPVSVNILQGGFANK
ncbi:MAG TPA: glycoside hydrolase family 36 protein [Tepidisphaeraceae bacterium]